MNDQIKFSCLSCGQHIECDVTETGRSMVCPSCGANLTVPHVMSEIAPPPVLEPAEDNPFATPSAAQAPGPRRLSGMAVASLICSLTCIGLLPGIICGHVARYKIRHDPTLTGKGLATAGLIISYLTVLFVIGLTAYVVRWTSADLNQAFQIAQSFVVTNPPASAPTPKQTAINESAQNSSSADARSGWTLDVKHATIPGDAVSGQVHNMDFQLGRALFRNGIIRLISSDGQEWVLIHNLGDSIANDNLEFQTASGTDAPKVEIGWKDGDDKKTEMFQDGYAMELKLGSAKGRRISGQIYLCVPDDSKSYIAGTFTIILPKPKPEPQPAQ